LTRQTDDADLTKAAFDEKYEAFRQTQMQRAAFNQRLVLATLFANLFGALFLGAYLALDIFANAPVRACLYGAFFSSAFVIAAGLRIRAVILKQFGNTLICLGIAVLLLALGLNWQVHRW
jgi:hypothetical protein